MKPFPCPYCGVAVPMVLRAGDWHEVQHTCPAPIPESLRFQRSLVSDMNLVLHRDGRLSTDVVATDPGDGAQLTRLAIFSRYATTLAVLVERGAA